jgi:hypothetical protein
MVEKNQNSDILFYTTPTGSVNIEVVLTTKHFGLRKKHWQNYLG